MPKALCKNAVGTKGKQKERQNKSEREMGWTKIPACYIPSARLTVNPVGKLYRSDSRVEATAGFFSSGYRDQSRIYISLTKSEISFCL